MSLGDAAPRPLRHPFTISHAAADHWGLAAKGCLEGVAGVDANIGLLYATEAFAHDLSSILTFLRETTRIQHWIGAVAPGVCADGVEYRSGGALAVMVGRLPEGDFHCFSGLDAGAVHAGIGAVGGRGPDLVLVHGDPRNPGLPALVAAAADSAGCLVGGLVSSAGAQVQVADSLVSGGLSGLVLSGVEPVVGLTQGCSPIGPAHTVTEAWEGVLMGLDGRPALEVLKEDAGELMARDLRRVAGYLHVGMPAEDGGDGGDYLVRSLVGIDPRQGWLAVADRFTAGQKVMFVRRDANAAQADMTRMLAEVRHRLGGRAVRAALYFSCAARGRHMFGADGHETAMIKEALGDAPLIGLFANGEIARGRVYGYTGVLAVLPEDAP